MSSAFSLNPAVRFRQMLPSQALSYGTVLSHQADGVNSRVELPSGEVVVARGQGVAIGGACWMRSGEIIGEAPAMTVYGETV